MPKITYSAAERSRQLEKLDLVSATGSELTDEMLKLARDLSLLHGKVRVCKEVHGFHFYMASPACLEEYGASELDKCHLALNVSKYMAGENMIAMCMKTDTPYNVMDLLSMPPLSKRGYEDKPEVIKVAAENLDFLEPDAQGVLVPKGPGKVTPVYQLPPNHPARLYLRSRGFDPLRLYQQFRLSYGEEERTDMFYRRLLNGFRATPQGRLIFFIDVDGVQQGWQARILEVEENGFRYYWHPYKKAWVKVLRFDAEHPKKWVPVDERWEHWDPVKYFTAHGTKRNECLMGFDAALAHKLRHGSRHCVFMEGPLDAGRIGPPALAMIGKSLSAQQLALMTREFDRMVYVPDNDPAGLEARDKTLKLFASQDLLHRLTVATLTGDKDLGAMAEAEAMAFVNSHL